MNNSNIRYTRNTLCLLALSLLLLAPLASLVHSEEIYTWEDDEGVLHMTNDPSTIPPDKRKTARVSKSVKQKNKGITQQIYQDAFKNKDYILAGVMLVIAIVLARTAMRRIDLRRTAKHKQSLADLLEDSGIESMSPEEFKSYTIDLLKKRGFTTALPLELSPIVDITVSKGDSDTAVSIIHQSNEVSKIAVNDIERDKQKFSCENAMVITNSTFSHDAKELAQVMGTTLVDKYELAKWISDNQ